MFGGESRIIGAKAGEDAGDESVGPTEGEEGGDDESSKGAPKAIITYATKLLIQSSCWAYIIYILSDVCITLYVKQRAHHLRVRIRPREFR